MISRILAVTICFALLVPGCSADEQTVLPTQHENAGLTPEKADAVRSQAAEASILPGQLTQEEESSLSARSEEPSPEVAGGALSNLHLTYVVIALAAIVLVLLIK